MSTPTMDTRWERTWTKGRLVEEGRRDWTVGEAAGATEELQCPLAAAGVICQTSQRIMLKVRAALELRKQDHHSESNTPVGKPSCG